MDGRINFVDYKVYNIHKNQWHGTCSILMS